MGLLDRVRQLVQAPPPVVVEGEVQGPARPASWSTGAETAVTSHQAPVSSSAPGAGDQLAVERYRYLLRTSSPEQVEQVHAEAFAKLTPAQRRQVLVGLAAEVPISERVAAADDPRSLARMATRAEMRRPGTLERVFGGVGVGGVLAGGLLVGVAGAVVGSVLVDGLLDTGFGDSGLFDVGGDDGPFGFGGFDGGLDF